MTGSKEDDSLFTLCTNCRTCTEKCVVRSAVPGSLSVRSRVRGVVERRPNRRFSRMIEKYWHVPGHDGADQRAFEILPDGSFDLVFVLGDQYCRLLFFGPFTRKVFSPIRNSHEYFCIRFRPGWIPRLADVHPSELVDNAIYLPKMLGIDTDLLSENMYRLSGIDSRQRFIEEIFHKERLDSTVPTNRFLRVAEKVALFQGQIRVDDLAAESGMSCRTLERLFREEVGIPPKTFIRFVRFHNAVERLRKGAHTHLAEIAYDSGYADQSHFIKDFRQFFGGPPSSSASLSSVAFLQYEISDLV